MKTSKLTVFISIICLVLVPILAFTPSVSLAQAKTLKIGFLSNPGWSLGLGAWRYMQIIAEAINKEGGLQIGGEKYTIDLRQEDSKMQSDVARSAVEKLVYHDKVQFIVAGVDSYVDAWLPITEQNKVLTVAGTPQTNIYKPEFKYCFQGTVIQTQYPVTWGWFAKKYPNLKTLVTTAPDSQIGKFAAGLVKKTGETFDMKVIDTIYVPVETTEFSSVATKIKSLNPDVFVSTAIPTQKMGLIYKSLYQQGWRGQNFFPYAVPASEIATTAPKEAIEGTLGGMMGTEVDSPNPIAKKLKDGYIAKFGTWDDADTNYITCWYLLEAGLKQAQSVNPETVAAVISKGIKFEGPNGPITVVARQDQGSTRANETVQGFFIKRIENGKAKLLETISLDDAYAACKKFYGWK